MTFLNAGIVNVLIMYTDNNLYFLNKNNWKCQAGLIKYITVFELFAVGKLSEYTIAQLKIRLIMIKKNQAQCL